MKEIFVLFTLWLTTFVALTIFLTGCITAPRNETDDYETGLNEDRRLKDEDFRADPESPIPSGLKTGFKGLKYFPPSSNYVVTADLTPDRSGEYMRRNAKDSTRLYKAFRAGFTLKGKKCELTLYWNDSARTALFIPFRDSTSGHESYGGGRYLDLSAAGIQENKISIDFNRCYNPYCAYNSEYSCPIPPPENRLSVAVRAGEMLFEP